MVRWIYVRRMARRKTSDRKESSIRIRLRDDQKVLFTEAAKSAGLGLSAWVRFICLREVKREGRSNN